MTKQDDYIWNKMWEIGNGERVTVLELFHAIKNDDKFYEILGLNHDSLEDRRKVHNYDWLVPKLKQSLTRLEKLHMMRRK